MTKSITTTNTEADSIEVSRNAKGDYSWSIKVYGDDLDKIKNRIDQQAKSLDTTYPVKHDQK